MLNPKISDLSLALEQPGSPTRPGFIGMFQISDSIHDMFYAHEDDEPMFVSIKQDLPFDRFEDAKRLYQTIRDNAQIDDGTGKKICHFLQIR